MGPQSEVLIRELADEGLRVLATRLLDGRGEFRFLSAADYDRERALTPAAVMEQDKAALTLGVEHLIRPTVPAVVLPKPRKKPKARKAAPKPVRKAARKK